MEALERVGHAVEIGIERTHNNPQMFRSRGVKNHKVPTVECYDYAFLSYGIVENLRVRRRDSTVAGIVRCLDVVPQRRQLIGESIGDVLVQFDLHA